MPTPVTVSRIQHRRGTQSQFDALYPPGYNGTGAISMAQYPNILKPGEMALCTDTRRLFVGNEDGSYLEICVDCAEEQFWNGEFEPLCLILPPSDEYTVIPELTVNSTPFYNIIYSIVNYVSQNPNVPGTFFSKNGTLQITCKKNI